MAEVSLRISGTTAKVAGLAARCNAPPWRPRAADVRTFGRTAPTVTKVNVRFRKSQVTCLLLAVLEGIDYWKANDIRYWRLKVQFRFWLITSLIVAFVAYL